MQLQILLGNPEKNLSKVTEAAFQAASEGSSILLLPELWSNGYDWNNRHDHKNQTNSLINQLSCLANEHMLSIGGSFLEENNNTQLENIFSIIQPEGIINKYSKLHLINLMEEKKYLHPGEYPVTVSFPWGKAGLALCYDLRFPELFRYYAMQGCDIIFLVAEWPEKRIDHWDTLLRARAIENQIFIAAVNNIGETGNELFGGHSKIISPWGEIITDCQNNHDLTVTAEIDFIELRRIRSQFPALKDRRDDLFNFQIIE